MTLTPLTEFHLAPLLILLGVLAVTLAVRGYRRAGVVAKVARGSIVLLGVVLLVTGGGLTWYAYRPRPSPSPPQDLVTGVSYERRVRHGTEPAIIHIVRVNLKHHGLRFEVTRPIGEGPQTQARTATEFLEETGLDVALNGGWFIPCGFRSVLDYVPSSGDPVTPLGLTGTDGQLYQTTHDPREVTLYLGPGSHAAIGEPPETFACAVSGLGNVVRDGRPASPVVAPDRGAYPRAALGLDAESATLILVAVDGKQPPNSLGLSLDDLAALMIELGVRDAIRLDEGGSVTLAARDRHGRPRLLNTPIHTRIPGRQRPIATHLGVATEPLNERPEDRNNAHPVSTPPFGSMSHEAQ